MDLISLVEAQASDGQRFIDRLIAEGFPVVAAAWIKEYEVKYWYLFVFSPVVDREGIRAAYMRTGPILDSMPRPFHVGSSQTRLKGVDTRLGRAVLEIAERLPPGEGTPYIGFPLGDMSIDEAYIYPAFTAAAH